MSGECQVPLQQPHQQRYRLPFAMQSASVTAGPWLAACHRDATTAALPPAPATADYWLRHRVDYHHQQPVDASTPAASCYFNRHQGKFAATLRQKSHL